VLDIFFGRGEKVTEGRKFKKTIEVDAYTQLFSYWKIVSGITNISVDSYSEGCFLKLFFTRISKANIELCSRQFADRIITDHSFFSLLIKKYVRASEFNRSLGKTFSERVLSP
jgi:hypothetical protein